MDFPRFTSGSVGRLTFEHVNEICSMVEQLRPLLRDGPISQGRGGLPILFARITAANTQFGNHDWVEVEIAPRADVRTSGAWRDKVDGRKSAAYADGDRYQPAFAIREWNATEFDTLPVNAIAALVPLKGADGKPCWLAIASMVQQGGTFPARILSAQPLGTQGQRWVYAWEEVQWSGSPINDWTTLQGGRTSGTVPGGGPAHNALNGAERPGGGSMAGGGPGTATALPIPNGVVVSMGYVSGGGVSFFSLNNPYQITCTTP